HGGLHAPMPSQHALPLTVVHVPGHSSSGSLKALMKPHTPFTPPIVLAPAQDLHVALHPMSQQMPWMPALPRSSSGQNPLTHSAGRLHAWPFRFLQLLKPSHAWVALQPATCAPAGTLVHAPTFPARSHRAHAPLQELLQQYPSWQKPLRHSTSLPH